MSDNNNKKTAKVATPGPLYQVRESGGRGRGLFATKDLPKGTLILLDKPLGFMNTWSQNMTRRDISGALATMTAKERETFMTLSDYGGFSSDKLVRIFQTNGLGWRGGSCLYLKISLTNHSCRPNAIWTGDEERSIFFVNVTAFIPKDAEITVNYAAYTMNYTCSQRRALLKTIWGFTCSCEACSPPPGADPLMEAEGAYHLKLGNAYLQAYKSLELRMMAEGRAGRPLADPTRWFQNYKVLKKAMFDVSKICVRPEGMLVFTEPEKTPWTTGKFKARTSAASSTLVDYVGKAHMYGPDCRTFVANIKPGGLEHLEKQEDPGLEFCEEYMRQFGHLYK